MGQGEGENPRGGAKHQLIQKSTKVRKLFNNNIEIFVVHYDVFIKENIIFSHFKKGIFVNKIVTKSNENIFLLFLPLMYNL